MKFAASTTVLLVAITPTLAFTKVNIAVKCKGVNVNKLGVSEQTLVAHALESSYNDVHGAADSDDSELTDVHYGEWSEEEAKYLQQGGGYGGSYDCRHCPNDDDALLTVSSTAGHKAWEVSFVKELLETNKPSFAKISSCSIKMSPHASYQYEQAAELATVEDSFSATNVIIEPHCSGINFGSLSVSENALAGHILEESFNKVHSGSDADDKELSDVKWGGYGDFDGATLQQGGGYGGSYDCRHCPNDDDALLGLSGKGMSAWQAEFVAGLLGTGKKSFEKVKNCSIKMKPSPYYVEEPNVDIDIKCTGGPNFQSLSVAQSTFVAHSLQKAYNTVHGSAANDDSELTEVFFHAPAVAQNGQLMQGGGGYGGSYDCRHCPNDDDAMFAFAVSGAALTAWESEFVSTLVSSAHTEFQSIKSCDIRMKPHSESELSLETSGAMVAAATPVNIAVKCKGINFSKLSVSDGAFSAHILEDAYNSVHGDAENDDSELTDVVYGASLVSAGANFVQQGGGGYGGSYDCRHCPNDDDAMLSVSGAALTKWEDELTQGLVQSGRRAFQKVSKCSIKMSPKDFSTVVEEPVKCGLRACAEE